MGIEPVTTRWLVVALTTKLLGHLWSHAALWCRDVIKSAACCHCFRFNPLPGICGSLAVLAGPEADLAVWVFLRMAKTR